MASNDLKEAPAPDVLDVVEAPGGDCRRWVKNDAGEMEPCDRAADVLVVYDSTVGGGGEPRNCLMCAECAPLRPDEIPVGGGDSGE